MYTSGLAQRLLLSGEGLPHSFVVWPLSSGSRPRVHWSEYAMMFCRVKAMFSLHGHTHINARTL